MKEKHWDGKATPLWETVREGVISIYKDTNTGYFDSEPIIRSQIRSHALNLLTNLSVALDSFGKRNMIFSLRRSHTWCSRLNALFSIAFDLGALNKNSFDKYMKLCEDIMTQIDKLSISLNKKLKSDKR